MKTIISLNSILKKICSYCTLPLLRQYGRGEEEDFLHPTAVVEHFLQACTSESVAIQCPHSQDRPSDGRGGGGVKKNSPLYFTYSRSF